MARAHFVARAARGERDTRHARQVHAVVVAAKLLAAAECACMCMLLLEGEATFEAPIAAVFAEL